MNNLKSYWDEEWKSLHFDGIDETQKYEISNYGRIRLYKNDIKGWKILKAANVNGYAYFSFKSGKNIHGRITKCVHRLVAEKYVKRPSQKHNNVIHIDFNKWNNYYKNLKWATRAELFEHSQKSPRTKIALEKRKGEITNAKLTETDVIRLKKKLKRGKNPLYKIAKEFGITHTQLNRIRKGENWGHIKID